MNIGNAIRLCRVQRGLNQTELAEKAGLSYSYISLLECNKRDPVFSTLKNLADALNVPLVVLIFLASTDDEKNGLPLELREKLSNTALLILQPVERV